MNLGDQPAFPQSLDTYLPEQRGMSTRTWLAGMANVEHWVMSIIIQNMHGMEAWGLLDGPTMCTATEWERLTQSERFHRAVAYHKTLHADALLAELEKEKPCPE